MSLTTKILKENKREILVNLESSFADATYAVSRELGVYSDAIKPRIKKLVKRFTKTSNSLKFYYITWEWGEADKLLPITNKRHLLFKLNEKDIFSNQAFEMFLEANKSIFFIGLELVSSKKLYGCKSFETLKPTQRKAVILMQKLKTKLEKSVAKINSSPKVKAKNDLLSTIKSDFSNFRPGGDRGEITVNDTTVTYDFRHLGRWIDDEENYDGEDDDWREDNDQRIWAPGEYKKYLTLFKEWAKNYPWFKKVKLELQTSEKDWCEFVISLI